MSGSGPSRATYAADMGVCESAITKRRCQLGDDAGFKRMRSGSSSGREGRHMARILNGETKRNAMVVADVSRMKFDASEAMEAMMKKLFGKSGLP